MAKKKQRKKVYKPPAPKLETQFNCPECGRKKVVEVRFMKKENKGYLRCRACGEEYQGKLKRASTPIDIYYEWIDHRDQEKEEEYKKKQMKKGVKKKKKNMMSKENNRKMDMIMIMIMMIMKIMKMKISRRIKEMKIIMKRRGQIMNNISIKYFLFYFWLYFLFFNFKPFNSLFSFNLMNYLDKYINNILLLYLESNILKIVFLIFIFVKYLFILFYYKYKDI